MSPGPGVRFAASSIQEEGWHCAGDSAPGDQRADQQRAGDAVEPD